jgi:hypothetical protein
MTPIKHKIFKENLLTCVNTILFKFGVLHNYDLIPSHLNFRTFYVRQPVNALFLINVFKCKINCHSIMDTVDIHVSLGK